MDFFECFECFIAFLKRTPKIFYLLVTCAFMATLKNQQKDLKCITNETKAKQIGIYVQQKLRTCRKDVRRAEAESGKRADFGWLGGFWWCPAGKGEYLFILFQEKRNQKSGKILRKIQVVYCMATTKYFLFQQ